MIFVCEKEAVIKAFEFYLKSELDKPDNEDQKTIENILSRLRNEHDPIGTFVHGDYKSHAQICGYELTDDDVYNLMEYSEHLFDASIGINWNVIEMHLHWWAEENNVQKFDSQSST